MSPDPPTSEQLRARAGDAEMSESDRVQLWREHELLAAGYPEPAAARIAGRADVDLHAAVELITAKGCPPDLAAQILL